MNNNYKEDYKPNELIYSSRRWTSDNYTNYQEPRMTRVDGKNSFENIHFYIYINYIKSCLFIYFYHLILINLFINVYYLLMYIIY